MKTRNIFVTITTLLIFTACGGGDTSKEKNKIGIHYQDFAITEPVYDPMNTDWDSVIKESFGTNYRVADWNDLEKFYYEKDGDLLVLFSSLNLKNYRDGVALTRNGEKKWSSSRYYYASRHEHNPPSSFLIHDEIDNFLISLGSWDFDSIKILAVKKTFK